ncbi:hypothetical protein FNJ87_03170 [Nonlabens mediterrranea]|uniref:DUF3149 domain-containing protein n=1 Tax=Nonlabens mediterrranea TaxID=1419947 RepID=A0ABS0A1X3_9FLAO|nr:hypothetical protein [Nonlabens mediterrranea]
MNILPLVDWTMGAVLIGVFALVCIVLVAIVMNMMKTDKKKNESTRTK